MLYKPVFLIGSLLLAAGLTSCASNTAVESFNTLSGTLSLTYDRTVGGDDDPWRMAIMIVPEKGRKIGDFFADIPLPEPPDERVVGNGNARLKMVGIPKYLVKEKREPKRSFLLKYFYEQTVPILKELAHDFPNCFRKEFTLTYKEFQGREFVIRNAPHGRYYIWIQTGIDGNRTFHWPLMMEPERDGSGKARLDIFVEDISLVLGDM